MAQLIRLLYFVIGAFAAITLHEYVKALVSHNLGDPLPRARGRLSLNPLNHFEPLGFACMVFTGYGWGKPVPISVTHYKDRKKGMILTYLSPSVANLLVGIVLSFIAGWVNVFIILPNAGAAALLPEAVMPSGVTAWEIVHGLLRVTASSNVALALFNFIPVYPLDGAKLLALKLRAEQQMKAIRYEKIFQVILLVLMITGVLWFILSPIQSVFAPPVRFLNFLR
ncbi:MAG: site-2 protease family protein [Defluviitaleaceae bacterium]|nr:site-2 protease family protein [Defluviitaleaceae bacterium]